MINNVTGMIIMELRKFCVYTMPIPPELRDTLVLGGELTTEEEKAAMHKRALMLVNNNLVSDPFELVVSGKCRRRSFPR